MLLSFAYWSVFLVALTAIVSADASELSTNDPKTERGIELIKLGCGLESRSKAVQVSGGLGGSLTLRRLPELSASASVSYTRKEAQGLAAALTNQVTEASVELSKAQLACMKPYIDVLFTSIYRNRSSDAAVSEAGLAGINQLRLRRLYAPLYAEMTAGEADWRVFSDNFYAKYGRYSPVRFRTIMIEGRPQDEQIPMSDSEWRYWMYWVDLRFRPENQKLAYLINNNTELLIGGVMTPCMKALLAHLSAFEDSYKAAKADTQVRTWQSKRDWPKCIESETEQSLSELVSTR